MTLARAAGDHRRGDGRPGRDREHDRLPVRTHADGTEITTLGDSLFWTSTQLLTVSSQLPNPISTPARVFDVFLQAYTITVVAMLAGSFGAFFHRRGIERDPL